MVDAVILWQAEAMTVTSVVLGVVRVCGMDPDRRVSRTDAGGKGAVRECQRGWGPHLTPVHDFGIIVTNPLATQTRL